MSKDSLQSPKARKLGYSSQLAFVISLIAGSVGTGNIWRFPRVAAANGGAFVLGQVFHKVAPIDKRGFKPARDADAAVNNAEDEAARERDEHDVFEDFHDEDEHRARL